MNDFDLSSLSDEQLRAISIGDYSKIPDPVLVQMANKPETNAAVGKEQASNELSANRTAGAIIGGVAGGKYISPVVGGKYVLEKSFDVAKDLLNRPGAPSSLLEEAKLNRALQGTIKDPGITGRASQTTYNTVTQQIAENAKKQKQIIEDLVRKGIISETKIPTAVASTPSGVLTTERVALPPPPVAERAKETAKAAVKWLGAPTGVGGKIFNTLAPIGALAGAGAMGMDAFTRMQHGDVGRGIVSGLGALGSAASAIPHPLTRAIGTGVALGAPALNYLIDTAIGRSGYAEGGHATPAWQRKEGQSPSGGLNAAGRASYKRETGGTLKPPQPEGGARKKSFCKRMKGMREKLTSAETANDPDSRINKSLRKWKC